MPSVGETAAAVVAVVIMSAFLFCALRFFRKLNRKKDVPSTAPGAPTLTDDYIGTEGERLAIEIPERTQPELSGPSPQIIYDTSLSGYNPSLQRYAEASTSEGVDWGVVFATNPRQNPFASQLSAARINSTEGAKSGGDVESKGEHGDGNGFGWILCGVV